ncbi:MAG TPA: hypothetical protein VFQ61_13390, partial [Polyangiaceae bacterium]|nr:hypothetical protein [Polyangiaceae bacterium]
MTSTANSSSVSVSAAPTSASPVEIRVQRTGSVAVDMPSYQSSGAAGLDLEAALLTSVTLRPGERRLIP